MLQQPIKQLNLDQIVIHYWLQIIMTDLKNSNPNTSKPQRSTLETGIQGKARLDFVRKVFSIVTIQMGISAIFSCLITTNLEFYSYNLDRYWPTIVMGIIWFCCQFIVLSRKTNKSNSLYFFIVFTVSQTFLLARLCSAYAWKIHKNKYVLNNQGVNIIKISTFLALVLVIMLTLFTFYCKQDYTINSSLISMSCSTFMILVFLNVFTKSSFLYSLGMLVGLLALGFYLVINIHRVVEGKMIKLNADEYIMGSMLIYADVVVLLISLMSYLEDDEQIDFYNKNKKE